MNFHQPAALTALAIMLCSVCIAQSPSISFENKNITGLGGPLDIVNAGDGSNRMFIVQRTGLIKLWTGGTTTTNFINLGPTGDNIITSAGSEEGLLSLAFHPNYNGTTNRYFYVYYTDVSSNIALRRYETVVGNPNLGDVNSDVLLLTIAHPGQTNHNGGKLNFGSDGYLYFATGDGGGSGDASNNAQNGNSLLGKMLRIDVDNTSVYGNYAVPATNPYNADPSIDDRVYALGLRNPFRWSFDRLNGNIWIGDVGQGAWEEVDFRSGVNAALGTNYGWRCYEGAHDYNTSGCGPISSYTSPVFEYANPSSGGAAVTGGYVYRGNEYTTFIGYYIAADVYIGNVYLVWPNGSGGWNSATQAGLTNIVGFGEDENGVLYAVSIAGAIYKVVATGGTPLPAKLGNFTVQHHHAFNEVKWNTFFEQNTKQFLIQYSVDGRNYLNAGQVAAIGNERGSNYVFRHLYQTLSATYYRLAMEDNDGSFQYSAVVKMPGAKDKISIYPSIIKDGLLHISSAIALQEIQIIGSSGTLVYKQKLNDVNATSILLPRLAHGMYIVQLMTSQGPIREKIVVK